MNFCQQKLDGLFLLFRISKELDLAMSLIQLNFGSRLLLDDSDGFAFPPEYFSDLFWQHGQDSVALAFGSLSVAGARHWSVSGVLQNSATVLAAVEHNIENVVDSRILVLTSTKDVHRPLLGLHVHILFLGHLDPGPRPVLDLPKSSTASTNHLCGVAVEYPYPRLCLFLGFRISSSKWYGIHTSAWWRPGSAVKVILRIEAIIVPVSTTPAALPIATASPPPRWC
mmetsp:Transcript_11987/g.28606  ORF Transcript_11987/g.28606 Transcript_11987/m.28606 type:complete len:226 (-) Transcript_11987:124-801(-)